LEQLNGAADRVTLLTGERLLARLYPHKGVQYNFIRRIFSEVYISKKKKKINFIFS